MDEMTLFFSKDMNMQIFGAIWVDLSLFLQGCANTKLSDYIKLGWLVNFRNSASTFSFPHSLLIDNATVRSEDNIFVVVD